MKYIQNKNRITNDQFGIFFAFQSPSYYTYALYSPKLYCHDYYSYHIILVFFLHNGEFVCVKGGGAGSRIFG